MVGSREFYNFKGEMLLDFILNLLAPSVVAAVVSFLVAIATPWATWGVEKRRLRFKRRAAQIDSLRALRLSGTSPQGVIQSSEYSALRSHLDPDLVKQIESGRAVFVGDSRSEGNNDFWPELLDEVSKLEAKWRLL